MSSNTPLRDLSRQEFWQRHVDQWQRSELSQSSYCQEQELIYHQFGYWKRQLLGTAEPTAAPETDTNNRFIPVSLSSLPDHSTLSVLMSNGLRVDGITGSTLGLAASLVAQL